MGANPTKVTIPPPSAAATAQWQPIAPVPDGPRSLFPDAPGELGELRAATLYRQWLRRRSWTVAFLAMLVPTATLGATFVPDTMLVLKAFGVTMALFVGYLAYGWSTSKDQLWAAWGRTRGLQEEPGTTLMPAIDVCRSGNVSNEFTRRYAGSVGGYQLGVCLLKSVIEREDSDGDKSRSTEWRTVVPVPLPAGAARGLPKLSCTPRELFGTYDSVGGEEVHFESHDFDRRYCVRVREALPDWKVGAYRVFGPQLLEVLGSHGSGRVGFQQSGDWLAVFVHHVSTDAAELDELCQLAVLLADTYLNLAEMAGAAPAA